MAIDSRAAIALLLSLPLSGCLVMTPSPSLEAANLIGTVLVGASSVAPGDAQYAIAHPHDAITRVCIELNPTVALSDFVPAVQSELRERGIDSRLYDTGMQPLDCPVVLNYTAFLDWDRRMMSDGYAAYLTFASLTLRNQHGTVLASANYEIGRTGLDKWSSTRAKISPAVKALLADAP